MSDKEHSSVDFEQLRKAVDWSDKQMRTYRENRLSALKEFSGNHYADDGAAVATPVNFIELAATIYSHLLASRAPEASVSTSVPRLRPQAKSLEAAVNQAVGEIDYAETHRSCVTEALFSVGAVKVGIADSGREEHGSNYGEVFVDLISPDDYIVDMSARSRGEVQFEGNTYWLDLDTARKLYPDADLKPDEYTLNGPEGDETDSTISSSEGADLYRERIRLRDIYIYSSAKLVTYTVDSKQKLAEVEFDGPLGGPYFTLGFGEVPGNVLPMPPVSVWKDLHDLGNVLFRKLGKQADGKKSVTVFSGGDEESVNALKNAQDGDGIRFSGQTPETIKVGGVDSETLALFLQTRDLASYFAGNLDALGGLAPMTDTVGQDRLMSEAASARIQAMTLRVVEFSEKVLRAIAWYEWTDPVRVRMIEKSVPAAGVSVRSAWSMETRDGDFLDYNFEIVPGSMQDNSPAARLSRLGTTMQQYVMPLIPVIQSQGGQIDVENLLGLVSDLSDTPELREIVMFPQSDGGTMAQDQSATGNEVPSIESGAPRRYERVNRPGKSRSGGDQAMSQILMGAKVQPDEAASIGRPVS